MNKNTKLFFTIFLFGSLLTSCSGGNDDAKEDIVLVTYPSDQKPPISFFEDTVYINRSGGVATGYLSSPFCDEVEVVNNNSWLECTPLRQYSEIGSTSIMEFKASADFGSQSRQGYVYFRYRESPYREQRNLMDSVYVVQLMSDSVITDGKDKEYLCDEHGQNLSVFTAYSAYDVTRPNWMRRISPKPRNVARTKYMFEIGPLPEEIDRRSGSINFYQMSDPNIAGCNAYIEQRRAILFDNKTHVMKVDTERDILFDLAFGIKVSDLKIESSDPSVATLSKEGRLKALKEGSTLITVSTADGSHVTYLPVTVKNILNVDENKVMIGMGLLISNLGMRFYVTVENGSDKDIILMGLYVNNLGDTVFESLLTDDTSLLPAHQSKIIYIDYKTAGPYNFSCRLNYQLGSELYEIDEESGIVINY